ncbi:MAG: ABC transporter permease [Thermomicrobiales bacterium]
MRLDPRRIRTIFAKDLRDSIRDARVLVALLVPLAIGVFYNFALHDDAGTFQGTVVFAARDRTQLPDRIARTVGSTIAITFQQVPEVDIPRLMRDDAADLAIIVPPGFDAAVAAGSSPRLTVVQPVTTTVAGDYVTAAIEPALRAMAGQAPPATISVQATAKSTADESITDKIGLRSWAVLGAVVTMIAMIALLAVPVILSEEVEKKTLDALIMISSYAEVVIAKALVGVVYVAIMVPLLLGITRIAIRQPAWFVVGATLITVVLLGFGLLMAGLFKNANQLNTWSGVFLLPVIGPAFAVGLPLPRTFGLIVGALPTGAGAKLLLNSAATDRIFQNPLLYCLILVAWGLLGYCLLLWQLSRRQA